MADEENVSGYTPFQIEGQGVFQVERSQYAESAVELINAIKAHITVAPVYVSNEANSDSAGIAFLGGKLVPVAFYQGPAITYRRVESYLPSSAHPRPDELRIEGEIRDDMGNIVRLARNVAASECMQEWWSDQKGLEARAQQLVEGVRATAQFSQLQFAEADLAWAEHARDWTTRVPSKIAKSLRLDLDELVVARNLAGKPVTTEDIDTLLEKYRRRGLRELYEEIDFSETSNNKLIAQTSSDKASGIIFSPSPTAAFVYADNLQIHSVANAAVRIAQITMFLSPAFVACQNAPTPIPLTPIPQGATEMPVPTNSPTETSVKPVVTATEWAGGGPEGSYEATLSILLTGRQAEGGGYRIPSALMQRYDNVSDIIKNPKNYPELIDADGNSIAGAVSRAIDAYGGKAIVTKLWSGEGYVLELKNAEGNFVWAIDKNGIAQYRPDIAVGTSEYREVPQSPISGDTRYMVVGGYGILGVFQGDVLKATFSPQSWEWQVFQPLPPEPSATAAEIIPTSCKDIPSIQPVADKFLQEKGYTSWEEAIKAAGVTSMDQIKTLYAKDATAFRQAVLLDSYDFSVSIPGFEGKAQCVVFAVPTSLTEVKLLPVIISATRNDGTESGSRISDNPLAYLTYLPGDVDNWIKDHKGKAVEVGVFVFGASVHDFTFRGTLDGVDRSILDPFYGYALRIGPSRADPWQMIEQMNPEEPGLMVKLISGEPDW